MKTTLQLRTFCLAAVLLSLGGTVKSQSYTTISNGSWNSASTWSNGSIPPATNITSAMTINIKHVVTHPGGNINNSGTINIANPQGVSPKLIIPAGVNFINNSSGKVYITNGEYRQYRYLLGLETGVAQTGTFRNLGGYVKVTNSFVEVAQDWANEVNGVVVFKNSSLTVGRSYDQKNSSIDTIETTSIALGLHGTGNYLADAAITHFKTARFEVAYGRFELKKGTFSGNIDYISLKNHVLNLFSTDRIEAGSNAVSNNLTLRAYCIADPANYRPNGKIGGPQLRDCSSSFFPAALMEVTTGSALNFSTTPRLTSGLALQTGAVYKYEGVTPGVDALVRIDSLIGGASVTIIDDNTGGLGYIEGFQPEIRAGSGARSYAVFTINYQVTGTATPFVMDTFSITALDIDGTNVIKEFDIIDMGPGATASYKTTTSSVTISQVSAGAFRAINRDGRDVNGIDTSSVANMFTVSNKEVSSFVLKLGIEKNNSSQPSRQFGIYMKGFVYPSFATLPVKLAYFKAGLNADENAVNLDWATSSEKDVSHFSVEKSTDGMNFSAIGHVFAQGNSSQVLYYKFTDENVARSGIMYYRLRSVDMDGTFEYSDIKMVTIGQQNRRAIEVLTYPNPANTDLRVSIPHAWQGKKVTYNLVGSHGQLAFTKISGNASQTESLYIAALPPGFYIVTVACGGETAQQKILKR